MIPIDHKGYQLLHDGTLALSRIESNGIRIDLPYLRKTMETTSAKIRVYEHELRGDKIWKTWRKRFGEKASMGSDQQLGEVLFTILKFPCANRTKSGAPSVDESDLEKLNSPFIGKYLRWKKLNKALSTNLRGIMREVDSNGFLHPVFNLNTVETFRSSSEKPNFQNFPVRDVELAEIVRRCFIARENHVLVENDYKGVEVSVSACYHKDKNFISYIIDPSKDMHRDMAMQLYMVSPEEWKRMKPKKAKDARYGAKNMFVFPQFYGDYYIHCAQNLWEWAQRGSLEGPDGLPMLEWLKKKGIHALGPCNPKEDPLPGTFEKHVRAVENDFWKNRFKEYGRWKERWYEQYLEKGYFDTYTGFRIEGVMDRKQVINYPVQGSAFHCLLWSLIRINRQLAKYKMKSLVVGQIHDSIIGDVHVKELRDYLDIVHDFSTRQITKDFTWLNVPLVVENEICPRGSSWFSKKEFGYSNRTFSFKKDDKAHSFDSARSFLEFLGTL